MPAHAAPGPHDGRVLAAVLFDMDGTLVDSEKLWDVSLAQLADHLGGTLTPSLREEVVGGSLMSTIGKVHAALGVPDHVDPTTSAEFLLDATGELFRTDVRWRPGARELLTELRDAGVPMALVTSTVRRLTDLVLDAIGHDWFAATVCGDEVEHVKPAGDPYARAARLLGVDPTLCAAVEDSDTGTRSALAAGCAVLTVPHDAPVPDGPGRHFAGSLTEVDLAALDRLVGEQAAARAGRA